MTSDDVFDAPRALYSAGIGQRIYEEVWTAAEGDARTALAILQGLYLEAAIRLVLEEQPSEQHLRAIAAFCNVPANMLQQSARAFGEANEGRERRRDLFLGKLGAPQNEGARFAMFLRKRFETVALTQSPTEPGDD